MTTPVISSELAPRPGRAVPRSPRTDATSPSHAEVARRRRLLDVDRHRDRRPARARTRSTPRPSTPPATATRSHRSRSTSTTSPRSTDDHRARRLPAAGGRPHGRRRRRALRRRHIRVPARRPAPGLRPGRHHRPDQHATAQHSFRTRVVDKVGNDSGWRSQTCGSLGRPDRRHDGVPSGWVHDPDGQRPHRRHRHPTASSPASSGALDGQPGRRRLQPGQQHGARDGLRRRRAQLRGPHDRRRRPRPGMALAPGQDRHGPPDRPDTTVASGWLPQTSLTVNVHGTRRRLRDPAASSGGSTAATSDCASGDHARRDDLRRRRSHARDPRDRQRRQG